jgi:hypothetical protein
MVDRDPQQILCLLALRFLGSKSVPAGSNLFKKGLKPALQQAVAQGWVIEQNVRLPVTSKTGKKSVKATPVLDLTEKGEEVLRQAVNADDLAVAAAAQRLAALREGLEADRQSLRQEVFAAAVPKGKKGGPSPQAEIAKLSKAMTDMAVRLHKLEDALRSTADDAVLAKIDEVFGRLLAKIQATPIQPPPSRPPAVPSAPQKGDPLRAVLRQAYEKLCRFIEFESGLVEVPRLYHEARALQPTLTLDAFHRELESLASQRVLELQVLNEVRTAIEPEKAIRRGDNLYYFVYWKQP